LRLSLKLGFLLVPVYAVEMLRWGDPENHHYLIGVYSDFQKALAAGIEEERYRGGCGKYEPRISECEVDGDLRTICASIDVARKLLKTDEE